MIAEFAAPFSLAAFWRYFRWGLEFLYVWPALIVTLLLAGNLVAAIAIRGPFGHNKWRNQYWLMFVSLLFVPATTVVGVIGAVDPNPAIPRHPNTPGLWITNAMFVASIAFGAFWTYRMKGLRWFASAFALVQLLILCAVGLIAGMALTGDWI